MQHLHVSSAEFASCSSGRQSHSSPSVVFSSSPSETVCSILDTTQDFVDNSCTSSGSDNNVNCVVPDSDHQSQSFHIQDSSSPSTNLPPHCQDSSIPQHIDLDLSEISQVDISKDSSVLVLVYTQEGSLWSIVLRCDDHTGIFTCDGCARDPYFYVPAETQSYVIKLSCSWKVLAASGD